ncbi:MAG: ATP-dependent RecD-like DNA helicase [Bacilli bacterium]|nr:ATP-dependent RecD-like DNA helicase [Bacilli bacterium]
MSKIVGSVSKIIFKSENSYLVMIFKVKENDIDKKYNNRSITATGYLYDIDEGFELELVGEFQEHNKYGEQFNISSYQKVIPTDENGIIKFFTSDYFKGIGDTKALDIYETLGDDCVSLIKNDSSVLDQVKSLSKKNKEVIINKLNELDNGSDTILSLTKLGFDPKDAGVIYKYYKAETLDVVDKDIYQIYYDLEKFSFSKIDGIAKKNKILVNDKRRVKAGIIYSLNLLAFEKGDTYSYFDEIFNILRIVINYEPSESLFLECLNELIFEVKIIELNDKYQLIDYYEADNNIVKRLTYLNNKSDYTYKKDLLDSKINEYEKNNQITYDDKQKEAIKNAFLKNFLIITGGPGTGKTTIIKSIVSLYKDIFKVRDMSEIALLAPTGRASKRIMEATLFPASTIHRFLKWNKDTNKFQVNEYSKSDAKLVIVDEVSMLDTMLFASLLNGLKYDTKIILVGDSNQLPSVSPGEVLKDLIDSGVFKVISLERLYRQSKDSNIIDLAYSINKQEVDYTIFNKGEDLFFYKADSTNIKENLITIINKYKHLDYHDFQIMAPMYKTLNGINNLNKIMQELLNPKSFTKREILIYDTIYREGDKVLQLMNMPDDNIYNGDIGVILEIDPHEKLVTIDFDSNIVTFNSSNFNNFTLGYVISIHKSQGSEFKTVVIPILNEYGRMLYKKLIYTGITRSKNKLILLGEVEAFNRSVFNDLNTKRKTNLSDKIKKRYE